MQQSIVSARGLSPCKVYKRWVFPAIETFVSSWVDLGFEPQKRNSRRKTVKVAFFASSHGIIFSRVAFRRCEQYEGLSVSLALTSPRNLGGDSQDSAIARCECLRFWPVLAVFYPNPRALGAIIFLSLHKQCNAIRPQEESGRTRGKLRANLRLNGKISAGLGGSERGALTISTGSVID